MITDTFENLTEEIIQVRRSENAVKVDACILTFSHVILKHVLESFNCTKIGDLFSKKLFQRKVEQYQNQEEKFL